MSYTQTLKDFGRFAQVSYLKPDSRVETLQISGDTLNYIREKSNDCNYSSVVPKSL